MPALRVLFSRIRFSTDQSGPLPSSPLQSSKGRLLSRGYFVYRGVRPKGVWSRPLTGLLAAGVLFVMQPPPSWGQEGFASVEQLLQQKSKPIDQKGASTPTFGSLFFPPQLPTNIQFRESFDALRAKLEDYTKKTIPAHVVKIVRGKDGIPLPTEDELFEASHLGKPEDVAKILFDKVVADLRAEKEQIAKGQKLGACSTSSTTVLAPEAQSSGSGKLEWDRLFVRPDDVVAEKKLLFGAQATVQEVPAEQDVVAAYALRQAGIDCLPARLRVFDGVPYRDLGANALKNYEQDGRSGKMSDIMQMYLRAKGRLP